MQQHRIVSQDEWFAAHAQHLVKEKELTRLRDQLSAARRELPWVRVEKNYIFDTTNGKKTLSDLFAGRSQLVVKHFMFGPGWQEGCVGCSFEVDHIEGALVHLEHHGVTFVAISRAPLPEIEAFKQRMEWRFTWVSSYGSDFNSDFHVSFTKDDLAKGPTYYNYRVRETQAEGEAPGLSVFHRDASGTIFHTYSCYGRGLDILNGAYHHLDVLPKGRDEAGLSYPQEWVKHHDKY
jgi:predicted dithiol-disulfide oxidoreductase (DUF899 family)